DLSLEAAQAVPQPPPRMKAPSFYDLAWSLVRLVPRGRVVTYGQVATWLGSPRAARAVGYAMFNVQDPDVPWHRVINSKGEISIGGHQHRPDHQAKLLKREGVKLDEHGRIDLLRYGWSPSSPPRVAINARHLPMSESRPARRRRR